MKCPKCKTENYNLDKIGLVKGHHSFIAICENGHKFGWVENEYEPGYEWYTGNI